MTENRCNTVLVAYSAVPKIVKAYDLAFKMRLKSSFMSAHLKKGVSTLSLVEEMLEINRRKHLLFLLRSSVENALAAIPQKYRELLILRFLDNKTFQEAAMIQNISVRTAFRRFDRAREELSHALDREGLTDKIFKELYLDDPYIAAACGAYCADTYFTAKSRRT